MNNWDENSEIITVIVAMLMMNDSGGGDGDTDEASFLINWQK